jgi:TonB family protein
VALCRDAIKGDADFRRRIGFKAAFRAGEGESMIAGVMLAAWLTVSAQTQTQTPPPPPTPTLARRGRANLSRYFSTDDYPADAVLRRAEGTVSFRLEIDRAGRVVSCTVTRSSNDASLDNATCAILRARAQYEPALDDRGQPIAGVDNGRVTWRLPRIATGGFPFTLTRIVTSLRSDGTGGFNCMMTVNGVASPEVVGECGFLRGSGAPRLLESVPGPAEMTMIFTVEPASAAPQGADETNLGELWAVTAAEFSIMPDGNVGQCRTTRRDLRPANLFTQVPDPCERARLERLFEPATGPEPRNARLRIAVFVRRGAPAPASPE